MKNKLYKDLGVSPNADKATIKKAYRSKAQKAHPDKGGDSEQFKVVVHAYEVLGDEERRKKYDQTGDEASIGDSILTSAIKLLADIVNKVMDENFEAEYHDAIAIIKKSIENHSQELNNLKVKIETAIDKCEKVISRTEKIDHNGEDPLSGILKHRLEGLNLNLNEVVRAREIDNQILKIVVGYKYKVDKVKGPKVMYATQDEQDMLMRFIRTRAGI